MDDSWNINHILTIYPKKSWMIPDFSGLKSMEFPKAWREAAPDPVSLVMCKERSAIAGQGSLLSDSKRTVDLLEILKKSDIICIYI